MRRIKHLKTEALTAASVFACAAFFAATLIAQGQDTSGAVPNATSSPAAANREELEQKIKLKSDELERVNRELEEKHALLTDTKQERQGLQRELTKLDSNIKELELNMQADEIASQKLTLEIDALNYDIRDIEFSMHSKTASIGEVLRALQKTDHVSPLAMFLGNTSLADGFLESQSLKNLRSQLAVDVKNLDTLHVQLRGKIKSIETKKTSIDLHQVHLANRKVVTEDQKSTKSVILSQTKNKESEYEKQVEELRKQQNSISDEISKIEDQLRAAFDVSLLPIERPGVFAWPIKLVSEGGAGRITQHFGEKSNLYRGKPHNGIDIGAPIGTPIYAADGGTIMAVDNNDRSKWQKYQYGMYILIKHENSLATLYAHLSKSAVRPGQTVSRGDLIGYVGNSGYATGPHLHFGAYWAPSITLRGIPPAAGLVPLGVVVSPEDYL